MGSCRCGTMRQKRQEMPIKNVGRRTSSTLLRNPELFVCTLVLLRASSVSSNVLWVRNLRLLLIGSRNSHAVLTTHRIFTYVTVHLNAVFIKRAFASVFETFRYLRGRLAPPVRHPQTVAPDLGSGTYITQLAV